MGKVVIPSLSWRLVLLGVGLTSVIALGAGGLVYFQFGLVAAKKAWFIAFFIVVVLWVFFGVALSRGLHCFHRRRVGQIAVAHLERLFRRFDDGVQVLKTFSLANVVTNSQLIKNCQNHE